MELNVFCGIVDNGLGAMYKRRIYEAVDVFIDENNNVIKNRSGNKTIEDVIFSDLSDKSVAIKNNDYVKLYISKDDESKFQFLISDLINYCGLSVLDSLKIKIMK